MNGDNKNEIHDNNNCNKVDDDKYIGNNNEENIDKNIIGKVVDNNNFIEKKVDNNYIDNIETINNEEKNNVYYSNKECNKNDNDNDNDNE